MQEVVANHGEGGPISLPAEPQEVVGGWGVQTADLVRWGPSSYIYRERERKNR